MDEMEMYPPERSARNLAIDIAISAARIAMLTPAK